MTLGEKQRVFVLNIARLILWTYEQGYELTWGQTLRSTAEAAINARKGIGLANSLHNIGLAADLNLFQGGFYLTASEDHAPLGLHWKSLHPLNRWGGDFKKPKDGNHYSMEHEGRA